MSVAITLAIGAGAPVRVELTRTLTTVGSATTADVRVAGTPPQWLLVQRSGEQVSIAVLASGQRHTLGERPLVVDGVTIARARAADRVERALPVAALALGLAQADDATAALSSLLDQAIAATGADLGAVVLRQGGGHTVALARDAGGTVVTDGAAILSDTVLNEVLVGGRTLAVDDVSADPRLANVPSVVNLALRSVIAIPMVVGDDVAGALYLGARRPTRAMSERLAAELGLAASLTLPVLSQLRRAPAAGAGGASSAVMRAVHGLIARIAPTDLAVLISGETGTGKELAARALHAGSPRSARPMVAVNCAAIPANLFESELFGHKKGAFTGAASDRVGRLEAADGSTLFLDEMGELPPAMQAALLRALQERELVRVGDDTPRPVDFRLVCATNRDLDAEVEAGRFRADLLYRLREVTIELPPLRTRGEDIVVLAEGFLAEAELGFGTGRHHLGAGARAALLVHDWPGNVRELRAVMRRAAVLADRTEVAAADLALPAPRRRPASSAPALEAPPAPTSPPPAPPAAAVTIDPDRPLALARDAFVAAYCAAALERHGGNREAAAAALGISTRSLHRYLSGERD